MKRRHKRLLINFLLGFAICSLLLRAGLLAFHFHFYNIVVDLIGFALFWAVVATLIHLLLIERRHRIINSITWTVLLIIYIPVGRFIQQFSDDATMYRFQNYPREIVVENHPAIGGIPYATYSEATTYFGGLLYRRLESVDITEDDLRIHFPKKYERVSREMDYFIWESKGLLFNFEDGKVYPAVKK